MSTLDPEGRIRHGDGLPVVDAEVVDLEGRGCWLTRCRPWTGVADVADAAVEPGSRAPSSALSSALSATVSSPRYAART